MVDMKFKFTIQPYQTEAVESVVDVFAGQPFIDRFTYRRDAHVERNLENYMLSDDELYMGFANNSVELDSGQLMNNIARIQKRNNIALAPTITTDGLGKCSLDVEMETGTGKPMFISKPCLNLTSSTAGVST